MVRIVIALVLAAHGIGHSMGILGTYKVATVNPAWHGDSWILTGISGEGPTHAIGTLLWTFAIIGFVALGAVVAGWLPEAWWGPLAVGSSLVSLAGLLFFPTAFPAFSTLGALVVDLAVLAAVLWFGWVPSDLAA